MDQQFHFLGQNPLVPRIDEGIVGDDGADRLSHDLDLERRAGIEVRREVGEADVACNREAVAGAPESSE